MIPPKTATGSVALERKLAKAEIAKVFSAHAAQARENAAALRTAKLFPEFAVEINGKLDAIEALKLPWVPVGDLHTRRLIAEARTSAFNAIMATKKENMAAKARGTGNRHQRRAAAV